MTTAHRLIERGRCDERVHAALRHHQRGHLVRVRIRARVGVRVGVGVRVRVRVIGFDEGGHR
eukprot:scaffold27583_cov33-Phaeocystis_antarctica.AAC.2